MTRNLHVAKASPVHLASRSWLTSWVNEIKRGNPGLDWVDYVDEAPIKEQFVVPYEHMTYTPESQIRVRDARWPTIALVVRSTESYNKLLSNASLLLEGSRDEIQCVILLKVEPLKQDKAAIESGFVETHYYHQVRGRSVQVGLREYIYPTPETGTNEPIQLSWDVILGLDYKARGRIPKSHNPPALSLDGLRKRIDYRIEAYIDQEFRRTGRVRPERGIPVKSEDTREEEGKKSRWDNIDDERLVSSG
ncbi:hypothetical protein BJX64DRAFT_260093 [Aspergillus heterothallicus]